MAVRDSSELWRAGRAAWPAIDLDAAVFAAFLAEREAAAPAGDLYLACACLAGDRTALAAFEARYASDIDSALHRMRLPDDLIDEVRQRVRTKLFVRDGDAPPRLVHYTGRGSLAGWLRTVAVRTAIDVLREERASDVPAEETLLEVFADDGVEPQLAALKQRYAADVNAAFAHAFAVLTPRQRNLLRQHYLHGLTVERVATMYGVHRVTAFRWITQAKIDVLHAARARLQPQLGGDAEAAKQLLELLRSQLDLSLDRLLRTTA